MKKKNIKTIIYTIPFILFIILTIFVVTNKITTIDNTIGEFIISLRNDSLNNTMIIITNISGAYALVALSLLILIIIKKKRIPLLITINLIMVTIVSQIAKFIIKRPRPINISLVEPIGYSYPSGHSMVSMAYFGFLLYLTYKKVNNKPLKYFLITILTLLIIAIGFSRIYLGVHYFSDVLGGYLLSLSYLFIFITLTKKFFGEKL